MEFPDQLKSLRKQQKWTQKEVAQKLNISQQAYGDWERGVKKPTQENLQRVASLYSISVDKLLGNEKTDSDLSEVELLFRTTSEGMTEKEKELFKSELIEFMKTRSFIFKEK